MILTNFSWKDEVINSSEPVLVDFWAEWCGPCRAMTPTLESLSKDYKVCKVNVDKNQQLSETCKISAIPALLIIHNGKVVARHEGVTDESDLRRDLERCRRLP